MAEAVVFRRKTYRIVSWQHWDDNLNEAAHDFQFRFLVVPNIMLASSVTYARIDLAAAKANVTNDEGRHPDEVEYSPLACFRGADYELRFCLDEELPDAAFSLIHDEDPDGEEPVPKEDSEDDSVIDDGLADVG